MGEIGDGTGSAYPAALDTDTTQYNVPDSRAQTVDADWGNDVQDAILAIQAELGAIGSQNFLRRDGTLAMTAALDLGTFGITNAGPIAGATTGSFSSTINFPSGIIQADGKVGIGTSSPEAMVEVLDTGGSTTAPNTALILDYESDTAALGEAGTAILFRGKSSGGNLANYNQARIRSVAQDDNNAHGMVFDYKPNGSETLTEAMRISTGGRVGINQSSPGAMLEVDSVLSTDKGLIVKGAPAQTANLQELQDSAGAVLHTIDKEGNPIFRILTAVPTTPVDGMLAIADGTTWNPGSGKGLYRYDGGAWNFCG